MRVGLVGCLAVLWFTACGGGPCPRTSIVGFDLFTFLQDRPLDMDVPEESGIAVFSIRPSGGAMEPRVGDWRFSLFPSVQASQPCDRYFKENIVSVNVRSSHDFDATHPAGTVLNDLIQVRWSGLVSKSTPYQALKDIFPMVIPGAEDYALTFYFAGRPVMDTDHRFQVEVHLDNGISYNLVTAQIDFSF